MCIRSFALLDSLLSDDDLDEVSKLLTTKELQCVYSKLGIFLKVWRHKIGKQATRQKILDALKDVRNEQPEEQLEEKLEQLKEIWEVKGELRKEKKMKLKLLIFKNIPNICTLSTFVDLLRFISPHYHYYY